jgi:glycosyltransferase involved in cell wall biosynthesis
MNVLLYLKHFPAAGAPLKVGTNKAVHGLASGLASHGVPVTVLCEGGADGVCAADAGYDIHCFRNDAPYRSFRLAPSLKSYVARLDPRATVAILNGIFHPGVYSLSRLLGSHAIPFVVAPHGPYHPGLFTKSGYLKWPYWFLLERPLLMRARAIQLLDRRHAVWSRRLGVDRPVIEAPNGFSAHDVVPEEKLVWRKRGPARLLYWGRLAVHAKGLDILLAAFSVLAAEQDVRLVIQGPDWAGERETVEALVANSAFPRQVEIRPPVFDVPPPMVMLEHDVVCMPSRFEGFGLAILEAMLAARVVLVPCSAGIAPHVAASDCGEVMATTDEDAAYLGLQRLLARRAAWREMGLRGRDYAMRRLRWETIAADALQQYRHLVA